jgi:hypothetical protein
MKLSQETIMNAYKRRKKMVGKMKLNDIKSSTNLRKLSTNRLQRVKRLT